MARSGEDYFRALMLTSTAIVSMAVATPAMAQTKNFNVQAQSASKGLATLARQADVQILISARDARGKRTKAVRGSMTVEQALHQLLRDTGLRAEATGAQTYTVVPFAGQTTPSTAQTASSSGDESRGSGEATAGSAAGKDESADAKEIVVTGTYIRGVTQLASPSIVIGAQEIADSGAAGLQRVFELLPQNFDAISPDGRFANEGGSAIRGANNERASGIDLRGLGPVSTLTLINGRRRAGGVGGRIVDISLIPVPIIDRVEIVTGGRSATYGSDAVAGVVNIITRTAFKGAQTDFYFGDSARPGGQQFRLTQTVGIDKADWGLVAAYDFGKDSTLDLVEAKLTGPSTSPQNLGAEYLKLNAQLPSERHVGYVAAHWNPHDVVKLSLSGNYANRKSSDLELRIPRANAAVNTNFTKTGSKLYALSGNAAINVGPAWRLNASADYSKTTVEFISSSTIGSSGNVTATAQNDRSTLSAVTLVADGPILTVGSFAPKLAIGIESRYETYNSAIREADGTISDRTDNTRTIRSAFAELSIPISLREGREIIEFSLAGRYDSYSDFGDTFNPQAGIIITPTDGLRFRGSYSKAYRAPSLVELGTTRFVFVSAGRDPAIGNALRPLLIVTGDNPNLQPERAESFTAGVDYRPSFVSWVKASLSYFDISYKDRIEQPSTNVDRALAFSRADRFPGLLNLAPTSEQVASEIAEGYLGDFSGLADCPDSTNPLVCYPNLAIFDNRTTNIAVERVKGLDFLFEANPPLGSGSLNASVNATYTLSHKRSLTPTSPVVSLVNEVGKPTDFRLRAKLGWSSATVGIATYLNYVPNYANPFSSPRGTIASWTTFDLYQVPLSLTHGGDSHWADFMIQSRKLKEVCDGWSDWLAWRLLRRGFAPFGTALRGCGSGSAVAGLGGGSGWRQPE